MNTPQDPLLVGERLTIRELLNDFGVLPVTLMTLGGLGWLDVLEKGLRRELDLITPFEFALNGYRRLTDLIADLIEPAFLLCASFFRWSIAFLPDWQTYFVLSMIMVTALARALWREGAPRGSLGFVLAVGGLTFALTAFFAPNEFVNGSINFVRGAVGRAFGVEVQQAHISVPPNLMVTTLVLFATPVASQFRRVGEVRLGDTDTTDEIVMVLPPLFVAAWMTERSPVLGLGATVAVLGIILIAVALIRSRRFEARAGLTMLGGVAAAALVLAADWLVKAAT